MPRTHSTKNVCTSGAAGHLQVVALDAAVGEVDAEELVDAAGRLADILGAGGVLGIDDALAGGGVAVDELEELGVDERREAATCRVLVRAAGIGAAAVEERVEFLDGGQPPVVEAAELRGVELGGQRLGLRPRSACRARVRVPSPLVSGLRCQVRPVTLSWTVRPSALSV